MTASKFPDIRKAFIVSTRVSAGAQTASQSILGGYYRMFEGESRHILLFSGLDPAKAEDVYQV